MTNNNHKPHTPVLGARDRALLRDLIDSRVMTLPQITALHFDGKHAYTKKRVLQLKHARYLNERVPRNHGRFHPSLLSLSRRGFEAFANDDPLVDDGAWHELNGRLEKIAESTLQHELDVVDMKVAFVNAMRSMPSLQFEEFSTYPKRFEFLTEHIELGRPQVLKPDGYARMRHVNGREETLYFEWDRSSEPQRRLGIKAWGYKAWADSGAFALWNGGTVAEREQFSFRCVFILPTAERLHNTAEHLLRLTHPQSGARLRNEIWLTTHPDFLAQPLGSIFVTLGAYKRAVVGTPFDPGVHTTTMRALARDRLVAERIEKSQLFGGVYE